MPISQIVNLQFINSPPGYSVLKALLTTKTQAYEIPEMGRYRPG